MLTNVMLAISVTLLLYWFRYSCRLILAAKPAYDYARRVADANELRFLEVQQELLNACERSRLDVLAKKLEDDYHLLRFLLRHSPSLYDGGDRLEQRMLVFHFRVTKAYYSVICRLFPSYSRRTVQELAHVVNYFANRLGERTAFSATAI